MNSRRKLFPGFRSMMALEMRIVRMRLRRPDTAQNKIFLRGVLEGLRMSCVEFRHSTCDTEVALNEGGVWPI